MPSRDWSSQSQTLVRRRPSLWVKIALGIAITPFVLGLIAFIQARATKARAWGVVLNVVKRLQTDEGTKILFHANPELVQIYGTENVFLDRVVHYRSQFTNLPNYLPGAMDSSDYFFTPFSFYLRFQGSGDAWLTIEICRDSIFKKVKGEGITRLEFSPNREGLDIERMSIRKAKIANKKK